MLSIPYILSPITVESFVQEYWESRTLHVKRDNSEYYRQKLPNLETIDSLISCVFKDHPDEIDLLSYEGEKGERRRSVSKDLTSLLQEHQNGSTIRIRSLDKHSVAVSELCRSFEHFFNYVVGASLYFTPPNSQAIPRHRDRHDVFVLQLAGEKRWKTYQSPLPLPLERLPKVEYEDSSTLQERRDEAYPEVEFAVASAPTEVTLKPGDTLFMPRGVPHEASTACGLSLHITMGIHVITGVDLAMMAIDELSRRDLRLRRALPIGFANSGILGQEHIKEYSDALSGLLHTPLLLDSFSALAKGFQRTRQHNPNSHKS